MSSLKKLFSEIADADVSVLNNAVVLYSRGRIAKGREAPFGLMCAGFMIRHALSFATMHNVVSLAIRDMEDRFVCYLLYIGAPFSNAEGPAYLARVGFGDNAVDGRETYRDAAGNHSRKVRDWVWRTVPNKKRRRYR